MNFQRLDDVRRELTPWRRRARVRDAEPSNDTDKSLLEGVRTVTVLWAGRAQLKH